MMIMFTIFDFICTYKSLYRVCAVLEAPPGLVLSLLQWDGGALRETLQEADEYHGTIQLLFSVSDAVNVFMKVCRYLHPSIPLPMT